MFEQFKDYDFSNEKKNEIFIDAFVHKVILYDDKVIIIYNYSGDNIQEIKKSEIEEISGISTGSDLSQMVEMQGVAPLRCLTGGSAAITPLAKKCPLDIFLNAPFNSLFDLYDKIKTQTIGLSFYFMVEMQGVEPWSKKRNLTPSPCASLFLFFTLNFKQTKSFNASQIYVCAMRFDIALHSPIFF